MSDTTSGDMMQATYAALTESENIVNAIRYAVKQGCIKIDIKSFRGWQDDCNCASCRSQRIVYDAIWGGVEQGAPLAGTKVLTGKEN